MSEPFEPSRELRKRFHHQLDEIDASVIRLFALVTEAWRRPPRRCSPVTPRWRANSLRRDALVDQLEADLVQVAERELVTQAPMARDMRYLVSVLRIVPELERSGDLAEHIAQRAATGLALRLTPTVRGLLEQLGTTCVDDVAGRSRCLGRARPRCRRAPGHRRRPASTSLHDQLVEELGKADIALADALQTTLVGAVLRAPW